MELPAHGSVHTGIPPSGLIGRLEAELNYLDVHEVFHIGLHEFLDQIQSKLNDVGDAIFETFFAMHETFAPVELVEHEN
jgi:uncharacterized alpha-E superfamily protein